MKKLTEKSPTSPKKTTIFPLKPTGSSVPELPSGLPRIGAPSISRDIEYRELSIRNLLKVWHKMTPTWKVKEYLDFANDVRSNLFYPKGFSKGKAFLKVAEIPNKIYLMMCYSFGQEWRNDFITMRAFLSAVSKFRINTTTSPMMTPDKIGEDNTGLPVPTK